jgi:type VI secretion system protein ImpJ
MLLSPQHLQAWDRHQESLVSVRVGALAPVAWGVLELEIDAAALAAGQLRLVRFAGIMPDGLPVAFEGGEAGAPPARAIGERFSATARSLDVHLAVPRERDGVPSFAEESAAGSSRFLVASRLVPDAASGGAAVPVGFARPNAVLLLGDEARQDHESMRIARIVRDGTGQLTLAEGHVPPCLRMGASPRLAAGLREVLTRAIAKQRDLVSARRHREEASPEATGGELARLLQLFALNEAIPALAHLAETPDVAPREVYLALVRLAGQLGTFSAGADPATLPRFSHLELHDTFDPLFAVLGTLLGALAAAQYVSVPLERQANGLLLARGLDDRLLRGGRFFLAVQCELPEAQVAEALPRLCKVAAGAEIQGLLGAAAPGLGLQVTHRPPRQIPLRPGALHFALDPGDRHWQGIAAGGDLAVYLPPPFDPARTKVELLAIPPQEPQQAAGGEQDVGPARAR